jgi:hypothetical protein
MTKPISEILKQTIFVFGSNLAGRHGAGAALHAAREYGAERGIGRGRTGNSYALPTKDAWIRTRSLAEVDDEIGLFLAHAAAHPEETFVLTPVGCGLAGFSREDILPMLKKHGVPSNVLLTSTWVTE